MKKTNKKGFTIVELVIVIAVIAILAAILIPTFANIIENANNVKTVADIRNAYASYVSYAAVSEDGTISPIEGLAFKSGDETVYANYDTNGDLEVSKTAPTGYTASSTAVSYKDADDKDVNTFNGYTIYELTPATDASSDSE